MILQSISLSGWRCYLDEITVGEFTDKLNVIFGSNGIGKSTLFEAIRRALMDSHSVIGQDIIAIQPWGRALSPKVMVAFDHSGVQYRVTKQFIDNSFTRLERKEGGSFRPLAEGRLADEKVRELLSKNPPGRGLSQARNWGLAQVLWAPQGELKIGELTGDLVSDIRSALGVQITDKTAGPIEQKITEIYDRHFTRQGKVRSGKAAPPIIHLNDALESARQRRTEAIGILQSCEDASRRVEELEARYRQLRLNADEMEKDVQNTRALADQYRVLKAEYDNRQREMEKTQAQHKQLQQHIELIRSTEKELEGNKAEHNRLIAEEPLKQQEVESRSKETEEAKKSLDTVRRGEEIVAQAEMVAEAARQYIDLTKLKTELNRRIQHIQTVKQTLTERKAVRSSLVAPDRRTLKAVRKAMQERDEAQLLMDAALISLEIVPESDGLLEIFTGEETGQVLLSAGKTTLVKGSPEVVAEFKGVARLKASGPASDVQPYRQTLQEKEKEIRKLTRPYGTQDINHLEELANKAENLDRQVGEALKEYETLLDDDDLELLIKNEKEFDAQIAGFEEEHPDWKDLPPDSEVLRRTAVDMKAEHGRKVSEAETAWERSQSALSAAREQLAILLGRLEDTRKAVGKSESHHVEVTKDGKSIQDRENELNKILIDWDSCRVALKNVEDQLQKFESDPTAALEKLEKNLAAIQDSAQQTRDEERAAMGTLEALVAQGPYSTLAQAEEEVALLEDDIRRETLHMDAIKLLFETVHKCRIEAVESVAMPVEDATTRLLHRMAGRRIGRIKIGQTFEPSGVSPELADSTVDLINLSGGEQEQLYLATRLALAEALAKEERQMVVLDDVLTATDTGRLARVMNILEEASERLQILILTCHPERYRSLSDALFFDLELMLKNKG